MPAHRQTLLRAAPVPDLQKAAGGCELVRAAPVPVEGAVQRLDAESQFSAEGGGGSFAREGPVVAPRITIRQTSQRQAL